MLTFLILSLTLVDPTPKIPIGKETTFVEGPVDDEGYIRYGAALNAMLSQGVTWRNNANVLLVQAFGPTPEGKALPKDYFQALGIKPPSAGGDYFISLEQYVKTGKKYNPTKFAKTYDKLSFVEEHPWSAKQYPSVAAWLQSIDKPLSVAIYGLARPRYYNPVIVKPGEPLIGALMTTLQPCRELARTLKIRAMLHIQQGQLNDAWSDVLACHRLARHLTHGGTSIETLVGYAVEGVAQSTAIQLIQANGVTAKQLNTWQTDFAALPPLNPFHQTLNNGERLIMLDAIQHIMRHPNDEVAEMMLGSVTEHVDWIILFKTFNQLVNQTVKAVTINSESDIPMALDANKKHLDTLKPSPSMMAGVLQLFMSPKERAISMAETFHRLVGPAALKIFQANIRILQIDQLETIAFDLAIHKLATGSYPKQLADLKLSTKPIDLYTGKPLNYTKTDDGYKLYSVGLNQTDDNGQTFSSEPSGDDLVVIVPIPKPEKE